MEENKFVSERPRLLDKCQQPTDELIQSFMGEDSWRWLLQLEGMLLERYNLNREIKFPFGNNYGWGFRYTHNKLLLLYVFFEENGFCCTISISGKGAKEVEGMFDDFHPKLQTLWQNRYPCGTYGDYYGGWIHYSVEDAGELPDIVRLVEVKVKPKKK